MTVFRMELIGKLEKIIGKLEILKEQISLTDDDFQSSLLEYKKVIEVIEKTVDAKAGWFFEYLLFDVDEELGEDPEDFLTRCEQNYDGDQ